MSPTRRSFLGAAAATAVAGCLGSSTPENGGENADPVLARYRRSPSATAPSGESYSDMDSRALFLASREAADGYFGDTDDDVVQSFVDETNFQAGERLLFVRVYASQTCYRLAIEEEPSVTDDGRPHVAVRTERTAPENEPCGDAMTPTRALLRLSFAADAPLPETAVVDVSGGYGEPETLVVEAEQ